MTTDPNAPLVAPYFRTDARPGEPQLFTGDGAGGWTPVPGSEKPSRWAAFTDDELDYLEDGMTEVAARWGGPASEPEWVLRDEITAEIERRKGQA